MTNGRETTRRTAIVCLGVGLVVGKLCVAVLLMCGREVPQSFWWMLGVSVLALYYVVRHVDAPDGSQNLTSVGPLEVKAPSRPASADQAEIEQRRPG